MPGKLTDFSFARCQRREKKENKHPSKGQKLDSVCCSLELDARCQSLRHPTCCSTVAVSRREAEGTHALCDAVVNNIRKAQKQTAQVNQRSLSDVHEMALMHRV